ncbi:UPF0042 nucleotide-binding protein [Desulfurobacterium pacificum]|uniref:UPF0042 nucleotide-binding protein n=1 Tax=Desulfurobacterium pacificum TaxID=240166 RepID=A0ABY1NQN6_9BACT|nr:RNase adapter RapZ [Desulfurobacterium pacificum]SMP15758.1 UPF0042 nucleotide-binding protein [Desulfurobacterium pacificum]
MKEIIILTGESGSGKSSAMRHLEDLGFYCIDNVPPDLLRNLIRLIDDNAEIEKAVLVMDIRNPSFRSNAAEILKNVKRDFPQVKLWFFTANKEELIKRFSETRRPHPFERYSPGKSLEELIEQEKEVLTPVKEIADKVIDTTSLNTHDLKRLLKEILSTGKPQLKVTVLSFGFKNGIPASADNVFDVRFLPNPHFVPELRPKTGTDREVQEFLLKFEETRKTLEYIMNFVKFTLPFYEKEGKSYITYAVGCTGGQHRSVALAEMIATEVAKTFPNFEVFVEHREQKERRKVET